MQLHSFTFPASVSHTWKSLISRDRVVSGDPWSPRESLCEPLSTTPSSLGAQFFSLHAFKWRCFTFFSSRILWFYSGVIVGADLLLSRQPALIYFRPPPFLPFSVSLSLSQFLSCLPACLIISSHGLMDKHVHHVITPMLNRWLVL